jgi:cytochrome c biogenesis protein CcmG, thiol:disulfide interchange protein DsbE
MKFKIFPTTLIIIFFLIFLIFYKGLQNSNVYIPNINVKKNIPVFSAEIFNSSGKIKSEEIFKRDKFYLMNIWASWCIPCRDEHVFLMNLSKNENVEIVGLNYKDNIKNAKDFLFELNNPYKIIISDLDGTIGIEWGAYGVPESFLIYNKKVIKKIIGPINENSFLEIEKIIQ